MEAISKESLRIQALENLTKARTQLVIYKDPMFGFLSMSLESVERYDIEMGATDGRYLFYNPAYIASVSIDETIGFIAEECLHVMFMHHTRRGDRNPKLWNIACDQVIFNILSDEGYFIPEYVNFDTRFAGMNAEQVYDILLAEIGDSDSGDSGDSHSGSGKGSSLPSESLNADPRTRNLADALGSRGAVVDALDVDGSKLSEAGKKKLEQETATVIQQAAQQAKAAGKGSGIADKWLESKYEPQVPWQYELKQFFEDSGLSMHDYTWSLPDLGTRHLGLYLPDMEYRTNAKVAIGFDCSGSTFPILDYFSSEISAMLDMYDPEEIHVIYCHDTVCGYEVFYRGDDLKIHIPETGGTAFQPVFDFVEQQGIASDIKCLVYFTDLYGDDPVDPESYPVIWCVADNESGEAPFGRKLHIKTD